MDPLSITASVVGIIAAAAKVCSALDSIHDAPYSVRAVRTEVEHIQLVFGALQRFVDQTSNITSRRAALISLEELTVILTQTVIVFSELQTLIQEPRAYGRLATNVWRVSWLRHRSSVDRLINQLQRHKASVSLLLQIIQA